MARNAVVLETSLLRVVERYAAEAADIRQLVEKLLGEPAALLGLEEELNLGFAQGGGLTYPHRPKELHAMFEDPEVEAIWDLHDLVVSSAKPVEDASYLILGSLGATGRIYSRVDDSDGRQLELARGADGVDEIVELDDQEFSVVAFRPVFVYFGAVFTPPDHIRNAGVVDVEPFEQ